MTNDTPLEGEDGPETAPQGRFSAPAQNIRALLQPFEGELPELDTLCDHLSASFDFSTETPDDATGILAVQSQLLDAMFNHLVKNKFFSAHVMDYLPRILHTQQRCKDTIQSLAKIRQTEKSINVKNKLLAQRGNKP